MVKAPDYALGSAPEPADNPALAQALDWAARGWPVFPLKPNDKIPLHLNPHKGEKGPKCDGRCGKLGHGVLDASRDPEKIRRMFAARPNANIGGSTEGLSDRPRLPARHHAF